MNSYTVLRYRSAGKGQCGVKKRFTDAGTVTQPNLSPLYGEKERFISFGKAMQFFLSPPAGRG